MLIVMSDLHLADIKPYQLGNGHINHNLPAGVYRSYFEDLKQLTLLNSVKDIKIVLAGDIFELHRNASWLKDELRPYINCKDVKPNGRFEKILTEIFNAICSDEEVAGTLEAFKDFKNSVQVPVEIIFIPGNHDRLINSSVRLRNMLRAQFDMPESKAAFDHQYIFRSNDEDLALVRHGHEYDPANFNLSFDLASSIPTYIDPLEYDKPVLGDIMTTELATKLPLAFRDLYTDEKIASNYPLGSLYRRLIEFDNVRPGNALMNFLFSTPGIPKKDVWNMIQPVFLRILDEIADLPDIEYYLKKFSSSNQILSRLIHPFIKLRPWNMGVPYWLGRSMAMPVSAESQSDKSISMTAKEECLQPGNSSICCVISGHTHNPLVQLMKVEGDLEKYYINTGTFRNVIASTPGMNNFGRLHSKARVVLFERGERNPDYNHSMGWSFDFLSKTSFGSEFR